MNVISIHAPARGATHHVAAPNRPTQISIHAPARGATEAEALNALNARLFQFTPLREGRRRCHSRYSSTTTISIHAPARGATRVFLADAVNPVISIHAPARGATYGDLGDGEKILFQFTPLREGRRFERWEIIMADPISIHAPARGATSRIGRATRRITHFNSRPCERGDTGKRPGR